MAGPLDRKLSAVLGERSAKPLAKTLDLVTVGDLLQHYPRRYVKRGELSRLHALPIDGEVTIVAEVLGVGSRQMRNRPGSRQEALISDGTGVLTLVFFNQPWLADPANPKHLRPGSRGVFSGPGRLYGRGRGLMPPRPQLFRGGGDEPPAPAVDPEGARAWEQKPV